MSHAGFDIIADGVVPSRLLTVADAGASSATVGARLGAQSFGTYSGFLADPFNDALDQLEEAVHRVSAWVEDTAYRADFVEQELLAGDSAVADDFTRTVA